MIKSGSIIPTRREVEEKISKVGDYVKMDYLSSCLKKNLDFDTKKFVLIKLSSIYESRGMYAEAAKLMRTAADINTTFDGKIGDFSKSAELFIKAGTFDEADVSFNKAIALGNQMQKANLKEARKKLYKAQALEYISKDRRTQAMKTYEKILAFDMSPSEKKEIQDTLLKLYEKLGKVREFYNLKKTDFDKKQEQQTTRRTEPSFEQPENLDELLGL